jgi:SAM-dependent methyltransferase
MTYQTVISDLRTGYDRKVAERTGRAIEPWKLAERATFLARLQAEGKRTLLEIGAGPGRDSRFFHDNGLTVTCTDLSPQMVEHCRQLGLDAHVMDFANLRFPPASFDAIFAQNCLLHVPKADFPGILTSLHDLLAPDGLFFLGQYGGVDREGIWAGDHYEPKRFFARYLDEQLQALVTRQFAVVDFHRVLLEDETRGHFQSLTLRRH